MLEDLLFYLIVVVPVGGAVYLVGRIVSELSDFSEAQRARWGKIRANGKWRFALLPSLLSAIVYFSIMALARPLFSRQWTIADLSLTGIFLAVGMFAAYLAIWRTNELKYLGKIPPQWKLKK